MEIWKNIEGFENSYQISNLGSIRSLSRTIIDELGRVREHHGINLKPRKGKNGYLYCKLWRSQKSKTVKIHRLVALYFVPKIQGKDMVNHKDGVKINNNSQNLEWVTASENILHAFEIGLSSQTGERNGFAKLTEIEILEIYKLSQDKQFTQKEIAKKFNTTRSNVSSIKRGKSWNFITNHNEEENK